MFEQHEVLIIVLVLLAVVVIAGLVYIIFCSHSPPPSDDKETFPSYMMNGSPYAPTEEGFGTKIADLAQPKEFYEKHYDATIKYLTAVYPQGKRSFESLSPLQLASFYNSLTFYYNCEFEYQDDDLGILPGLLPPTWDKLPCAKSTPLPYPPQGIFYNFYTYQKYNIPYIKSNSDGSIEYLKLNNFGNCRIGLNFTTTRPGQKDGIRPGPGMFWVNCRTIQRHIWYPNGFKISPGIKQKTKDDWTLVNNKPIQWNYPKGWTNGFKDNEFIEVTHFFHGPGGMTTSPGWWYNGFFGTGMFLNLGKTFVTTTKIGGVLDLATEMAKTDKGKEILKQYFNTDDPYMIVWEYQTSSRDCYDQYKFCAPILNCCASGGSDAEKGIPREIDIKSTNDFYKETIRYQKEQGIDIDSPTYEGIKLSVEAAARNKDFNLSRFSVNILSDEPMFFLGSLLGYDTIQLWIDPNSNGYFVYELIDLRLPPKYKEAVMKRDYSQMVDIKLKYNNGNPWNEQFVTDSINYLVDQKFISIRDPLDVHNDKKVKSCDGLLKPNVCPNNPDQPGGWYNLYCDKLALASDYKCLGLGYDAEGAVCELDVENPTC